jgi:hypothetical protein
MGISLKTGNRGFFMTMLFLACQRLEMQIGLPYRLNFVKPKQGHLTVEQLAN